MVDFLKQLMEGALLTQQESKNLMAEILQGNYNEYQIAAILGRLTLPDLTPMCLAGFVQGALDQCMAIDYFKDKDIMDTCGTGGDGLSTINVSTAASIIAASYGINIVKHCNKSITSQSGSTDVLECLGVKMNLTLEGVVDSYEKDKIVFLHAPSFHPAFSKVAPVRKQLGFKTFFNMLGPLCNPAHPQKQIIGVSHPRYMDLMIETSKLLGKKTVLIVSGVDPALDEVSLSSPTLLKYLDHGLVKSLNFTPEDIGLSTCSIKQVQGGTPQENAEDIVKILQGTLKGPKREFICLNVAAILYTYEGFKNFTDCYTQANLLIESGAAYHKLLSIQR